MRGAHACAGPGQGPLSPLPKAGSASSTWKRGGYECAKLGVISQERLKIEV